VLVFTLWLPLQHAVLDGHGHRDVDARRAHATPLARATLGPSGECGAGDARGRRADRVNAGVKRVCPSVGGRESRPLATLTCSQEDCPSAATTTPSSWHGSHCSFILSCTR
jgi:hypothetical protein